ncbi:MAG: acetyl-CoA carboxylase biotin carboxyl carrier protein subunit [Bacteroidales bacterium]
MSAIEIKSGDHVKSVEILSRDGNKIRIVIGGKEYILDIVKVEKNIYSVLMGNKSFDIEVVPSGKKNMYSVKYICHFYNIEIVDAELRYMQNRLKSTGENQENIISSPMPGKIVKVLVKAGDEVESGQVVIIVSAMKMESEYKSGRNGKVKEVLVGEGDIIDSNMPLIVLE